MVNRLLPVVSAVALLACVQNDLDRIDELPELDENFFRCEVQPVLASSCAFNACHGDDERPLRLYAEQRLRLDVPWEDYELPLTEQELAANLRTVRGFVARDSTEVDLLSEKPLDTRAGGLFHRGRDLYGDDDVFLSQDDVRYRVLRAFIDGDAADASCVPREDLGL